MTPNTKNWFKSNISLIVSTGILLFTIVAFFVRMESAIAFHERRISTLEANCEKTTASLHAHIAAPESHYTARDQQWRDSVTDWLKRIDSKLDRHMEQTK